MVEKDERAQRDDPGKQNGNLALQRAVAVIPDGVEKLSTCKVA